MPRFTSRVADDVVAVDGRVERRVLLEGLHHRPRDEREVGQRHVLLGVARLELGSPLRDRREVDLDDRRAVRRGLDRAHHVLGDRLSHRAHRLPQATRPRRGGRVGNVRRLGVERPRRWGCAWRLSRGARPGPSCESARRRRVPRPAERSTWCSSAMRRTTGEMNPERSPSGPAHGSRCRCRPRRSPVRREPRQRHRPGVDLGDRLADGHGLARLDEDAGQDAVGRARDLDVDLVGSDVADRLVGLDRIADCLPPLEDRPLGDRDAHLRHRDGDRLRVSS